MVRLNLPSPLSGRKIAQLLSPQAILVEPTLAVVAISSRQRAQRPADDPNKRFADGFPDEEP
jgi:hypothetical protein